MSKSVNVIIKMSKSVNIIMILFVCLFSGKSYTVIKNINYNKQYCNTDNDDEWNNTKKLHQKDLLGPKASASALKVKLQFLEDRKTVVSLSVLLMATFVCPYKL